jgi:hypothetical protein
MTGCSTDTYYTDARLILGHMNPSGVDPVIDTNYYRYFSFHYMLEGDQFIGEGWIARMGWWQTINGITTEPAVLSRDMILLEGWNTYSVDLWAADVIDEAHSVQVPWTSSAPNRLRFDPAELFLTRLPANFHIDWVKLTAMDEVMRGEGFPVEYELVADGATSTTFYYDTDTNPTNGRIAAQLASSTSTASPSLSPATEDSGSHPDQLLAETATGHFVYLPTILNNYCSDCTIWDTALVAPGEYYICIEASDAYNTSYQCSAAPVKVKPN